MEAIAALSLACNILQVAQIGCQAVSTFVQAYNSDSIDENYDIDAQTRHLAAALVRLDGCLRSQNAVEDSELLKLSQQCADVARLLSSKLTPFAQKPSRRRDRWRNGLKALRMKGEVEALASKLSKYQRILDTKILIDLRSRIDIASLKHSKDLATLDGELQAFIRQQIVLQRDEHELTRLAISQQHHDLSARLESMKLSQAETASYERLLSSLKYPGMNFRKNQIAPTHFRTFRWIFGEEFSDQGSETEPQAHEDQEDNKISAVNADVARQSLERIDIVAVDYPVGEGTALESETGASATRSHSSVNEDENLNFFAQVYQPDDFVDWLAQRDDNYWITGKPGSGKSTLMSFIVDHELTIKHLQQWAAPRAVQVIDAYFWNAGSSLQKSFKGMLATILLQLLDQVDVLTRQSLLESRGFGLKTSIDDWSTGQLERQIHGLLSSSRCKYCIVFDGLDEVEVAPSESDDVVVSFIELVSRPENVKCCISSRPLPLFALAFGKCAQLQLEQLNHHDIDTFFRYRLRSSIAKLGAPLPEDEFEELRSQFNRKADGVFLWAHLALESILQGLRHQNAFEHLLKRLEALPSELESLYAHMLSLNNRDSHIYQQESTSFIRIMLLLLEFDYPITFPLRPNLLQFTLCFDDRFSSAGSLDDKIDLLAEACNEMKTRIITRCAGLLEVKTLYGHDRKESYDLLPLPLVLADKRSQRVQLIHRTVKDFLLSSQAGRQSWEGSNANDENLNGRFMKAMLHELQLSIKPVTKRWLAALFRDLNERRRMWSGEALRGLIKQISETVTSSNCFSLNTNHQCWFVRLADEWRKHNQHRSGYLDQAPLDILGCIMQSYEYELVLDYCRQHIERMTPEYCLYLLSSMSLGGVVSPRAHIELYTLMMPSITKLNRLDLLRVQANPNGSQRREAVWRSALINICPTLLLEKAIPGHIPEYDSLLYAFCQMTCQYNLHITLLEIDPETGCCWYRWPPTPKLTRLTGGLCVIVVRLDPLHLVRCYASFCKGSQTQSTGCTAYSELENDQSDYPFEVQGFDINLGEEVEIDTTCSSNTFHKTNAEDSLLIKTTLFKGSSMTYLMSNGEHQFEVQSSTLDELHHLAIEIAGRSQEISYRDYLREQGLIVDATDPRALHEPPPMFMDEVEDKNCPAETNVIRRGTASSEGFDDFYDVES